MSNPRWAASGEVRLALQHSMRFHTNVNAPGALPVSGKTGQEGETAPFMVTRTRDAIAWAGSMRTHSCGWFAAGREGPPPPWPAWGWAPQPRPMAWASPHGTPPSIAAGSDRTGPGSPWSRSGTSRWVGRARPRWWSGSPGGIAVEGSGSRCSAGATATPAGQRRGHGARGEPPRRPAPPGSRSRQLAAIAVAELETELIVLDDGFQHRRLARDLDLVMIDALDPFGLGRLFPRGLLREPVGSLRRASAVILSRADLLGPAEREAIRQTVQQAAPGVPFVESRHAPLDLIDGDGQVAPARGSGREGRRRLLRHRQPRGIPADPPAALPAGPRPAGLPRPSPVHRRRRRRRWPPGRATSARISP